MKKILIAEDNELNRELVVDIFEANDYQTLTADNGLTAVELCKAKKPDLVLMDIQMPILGGYAALEMLRDNHETASIPVIALSGNAMPHDLERMQRAGFNAIITKPFKIDDLLKTVGDTLPKRDDAQL